MTTLTRRSVIAKRLEEWQQFMRGEGNRRLFYKIQLDLQCGNRPLPWPSLKTERTEWAWKAYQAMLERTDWLLDDLIPSLHPYTGTEIFAAAFGCEVEYPDDTMPFALPMVRQAKDVASIKLPSLDHPQLALIFDIADELQRRAPEALMQLPDIQSPMDIAALIWDKSDLYCAMIVEPQAVHDLVELTRELLTAFLDEWFRRYGTTYIAHFPHYPMQGGVTLSEDEVGAINCDMFKTFFRPSLVALSERYGGLGIHCCANSRHQWDNFRALPGLRLLNICQPADLITEAYTFFSPDIAHFHGNTQCFTGEPWTWPAQLPPQARAILTVQADTPAEAAQLAERMAAVCR